MEQKVADLTATFTKSGRCGGSTSSGSVGGFFPTPAPAAFLDFFPPFFFPPFLPYDVNIGTQEGERSAKHQSHTRACGSNVFVAR
jgi:hypothetical protein